MTVHRQISQIPVKFHMDKKKPSPERIARQKRIGENIKRLRKAKGIKRQQDLAEKLGYDDRTYIGRLESGHASFGSDTEQKLAKFFNVDISEFYKGIDAKYDIDTEKALLQISEKLAFYGAETIKKINKSLPALVELIEDKNTSIPEQTPERKKTA